MHHHNTGRDNDKENRAICATSCSPDLKSTESRPSRIFYRCKITRAAGSVKEAYTANSPVAEKKKNIILSRKSFLPRARKCTTTLYRIFMEHTVLPALRIALGKRVNHFSSLLFPRQNHVRAFDYACGRAISRARVS